MTKLRPNQSEVTLKRKMAMEYFDLYGLDVNFYAINIEKENLYSDDDHVYLEPTATSAIFQQFPNIKILKTLGWFHNDDEDLPMMMYISFYDDNGNPIEVREDTIVQFESEHPVLHTTKFKIKKVAGQGFSTMYWVTNVVPIHDEDPILDPTDSDKDGFSFIKVGGN